MKPSGLLTPVMKKSKFSTPQTDQEVFKWKDLSILQDDKVFKIGTDAMLLGSWVPMIVPDANSVLDVGTGTGVISMMLGNSYPSAMIEAIDVDQKSVELTAQNFKSSHAAHRLNVKKVDLFDFVNHAGKLFDLIVSNPPYYFEQYSHGTKTSIRAKHAIDPVETWMQNLVKLLKPDGHLLLVIPFDLAKKWIEAANESCLYCSDRLNVYSFKSDDDPIRSLLHFHRKLVKPQCETLVIYSDGKKYTEQYVTFSGIAPEP